MLLLFLLCTACSSDSESIQRSTLQAAEKVVFIGDSITQLWPLDEYIPGAINLGVSSDETWQMLERFDAVITQHPSTVVILGGINDIRDNTSASTRDLFEMVRRAKEAGARVIVGTILPADINMGAYIDAERQLILVINDKIRRGALEHGYTVVDYHAAISQAGGLTSALYADQYLHPSRAGYDVMWNALRPVLNQE